MIDLFSHWIKWIITKIIDQRITSFTNLFSFLNPNCGKNNNTLLCQFEWRTHSTWPPLVLITVEALVSFCISSFVSSSSFILFFAHTFFSTSSVSQSPRSMPSCSKRAFLPLQHKKNFHFQRKTKFDYRATLGAINIK